jgi:hypothetical protein
MGFRFLKRINANTGLFNGHFIDARTFYVLRFNAIPCITFISEMEVTKVFAYVTATFHAAIMAAYQHNYFAHDDKKIYFNNTIFVLKNKRMIELADNYCQVLHTAADYVWAGKLVNDLAQFRIENDNAPAFRHTHVVGFAKQAEMN